MYSVAFAVISVWCLFLLDDLSFYLQRLSTDFTVFFFGMLVAFVLALILHFILKWETTWSMLFSLTIGFFVTATLENALIRRYFVRNSNHYRPVLQYFRKYWKLILQTFCISLGYTFTILCSGQRICGWRLQKVSYVTSHTIWHPVSPCLPTFPQRSSLLRVWR